jgi:uncharacterized RDD family membrane protein YckC
VERTWYYADGDKTVGPLTLADLRAILSRTPRAGSVLVWREGLEDWAIAESVPELAAHLVKPPPLPPVRSTTVRVPPTNLPIGSEVTKGRAKTLHPWRRYFARFFDISIFSMSFFIVLGVVFPEWFVNTQNQSSNNYLYTFVTFAAYVVFEAIFLNTFGTTLGKLLYGIKLKVNGERQVQFSTALKRSMAVWIRGLGVGIPIITLITLIVAYQTLMKDGEASWDRDFNCQIIHRDYSALRVIVIIISWVLLFSVYSGLIMLGSR